MLGWLKDKGEQARRALGDEVSRFKNREFMQAVVAGAVWQGYADGEFSLAEKAKLKATLEMSPELRVFDKGAVAVYMGEIAAKFDFDRDFAVAETLKVIGRLKGNVEASRLLVRIQCMFGAADGKFDEAERQIASRICVELGLKPTEFDL